MLMILLELYSVVVLLSVILSWFSVAPDNPLKRVSDKLVEPVLIPIRRVLPTVGGLDMSPVVLLLALQLLKRLLFGF
ncbi:YggT family protein [Myxococcota bacterium]